MEHVKAWIINGPNLNLLGIRETEIYGKTGMDELLSSLGREFPNDLIEYFQSNHEGQLIDCLQSSLRHAFPVNPALTDRSNPFPTHIPDFVLLNPGGLGHSSVALADTVAALTVPVYEIHLTHPASRESFRQVSYITPSCKGLVSGFGIQSYLWAYRAVRTKMLGS
jgi:3-dehydroquinate dehydratase-2